ncbi:MAG: hypothetical protein HKN67_14345 [Saprospiraceae bacterium]|nr:hypothetical protein [Saprospiraceae bacterium]
MSPSRVRVKRIPNLLNERWKSVELPSDAKKVEYKISNRGRLKSVSKIDKTQHLMNPSPDKKKYMRCSIKLDGRNYALYIHALVARYWSKKPKKNQTKVIHKDLDRTNNSPSNVVWVTHEEWKEYLRQRAKKFGFEHHRRGGKAKLKEGDVAIIKKMLRTGKTRKKMIVKRFGVSHTQINRIERGENWGHVKAAK